MEKHIDRSEEKYIKNLYVYPTYAVLLPYRSESNNRKTDSRIQNEKNLRQNSHNGKMSKKATKRLCNSVNWLALASEKKWVYCEKTKKHFPFRLNLITLTLPSNQGNHSDNFVKNKCLHNFLSAMQMSFNMKNYVWKAETQKNGNIHFHVTTDTFVHHSEIRRVWNQQLKRFGMMDAYIQKMSKMTLDEYINERMIHLKKNSSKKTTNLKEIIQGFVSNYNKGKSENWENPNTTDVKTTRSAKNLSAYLASYMSKKEEGKRPVKGRIWACSYNISKHKNIHREIITGHDEDILKDLFSSEIEYKKIEIEGKIKGSKSTIGEIFFYKTEDIGKKLKHGMYKLFKERVYQLRNPHTLFSEEGNRFRDVKKENGAFGTIKEYFLKEVENWRQMELEFKHPNN